VFFYMTQFTFFEHKFKISRCCTVRNHSFNNVTHLIADIIVTNFLIKVLQSTQNFYFTAPSNRERKNIFFCATAILLS